jgi:hypothetical protein
MDIEIFALAFASSTMGFLVIQTALFWAISKTRRKLAKAMVRQLGAPSWDRETVERTLRALGKAHVDLTKDVRLVEDLLVRFERAPSVLSSSIDRCLSRAPDRDRLAESIKTLAATPDKAIALAVLNDVSNAEETQQGVAILDRIRQRLQLAAMENAVGEFDEFLLRRIDRIQRGPAQSVQRSDAQTSAA